MKKIFIFFISFIVILLVIATFCWFNLPSIVSHYLSKDFGIPISIENIKISSDELNIDNFRMSNLPPAKTPTALSSKTIKINATWKELRSEKLTIDKISINDINIGVELFNKSGDKNNWATIITPQEKKEIKKEDDKKKGYLIRTLRLNNISVILTKANGKVKRFPPIKYLEFHNISDETGFPIEQIEQAILQTIMKSIFQQYGLESLLKTINPTNLIPKIIELPFFGK